MSESAARKSRRFFFSPDFLIPVFLLIVSVLIFRETDLDLQIQDFLYTNYRDGEVIEYICIYPPAEYRDSSYTPSPSTDIIPAFGWYLKDQPVFKFVYHYGNIPALLLAIAGLLLLGLSFQALKWAKWRKIGLFLLLAMLLGPGLIINAALKDNWGRPRPRNVNDYGGKYAFEKVLSVDTSSPGKSFPCGHCSMGFYLLIPWFVLRKRKPLLARISLFTGIFYGLLIGIARMAQGGHWCSDVVFSGIIVYLTGAVLFYALKLDKALWFYPTGERINRRQRTVITFIVSVVLFFLILGVVLATPYSQKKSFKTGSYDSRPDLFNQVSLDLPEAELVIYSVDRIFFKQVTQGFGFPRSSLNPVFREEVVSDTLKVSFSQTKKGFFTELDNKVTMDYPFSENGELNLRLGKGNVSLYLPEDIGSIRLRITIDKGTLDLHLPASVKPRITTKGDFQLTDKTGFHDNDGIFVREDFKVNLIVRKGEIILH